MVASQKNWGWHLLLILCCILILGILLGACNDSPASSASRGEQSRTFTGTSAQPITYSTDPQETLIRTFYGGGLYGSFSPGPQISIYGDGTYILGLEQEGHLTTDALQQLLNSLVNTYRLPSFSRQQFSDIQDENATFLELTINGKQKEFKYGTIGTYTNSPQEKDEYRRLENALTAITEELKGPTQPYRGKAFALLTRQIFNPSQSENIPHWPLNDFTLAQATAYECGLTPPDETSQNAETGCLKFVIPSNAILLNAAQVKTMEEQLHGQQGSFSEQGLYYAVLLRQLLPDELPKHLLAMLGSAQGSYRGVPLLDGKVPPVPTPTPS